MCARAIATSSIRTSAGSSPACAWPRISEMLKQEIEDGDFTLADPMFRADVLRGFEVRPRAIPARWFYDRRGSELFEAITELPEYYLTRTERSILSAHAADIAALTG